MHVSLSQALLCLRRILVEDVSPEKERVPKVMHSFLHARQFAIVIAHRQIPKEGQRETYLRHFTALNCAADDKGNTLVSSGHHSSELLSQKRRK